MLFTDYKLGSLTLKNRIVMPPMTRSRAAKGDVATALMAEYYRQRATAGLIISEGTQSAGRGRDTPGPRAFTVRHRWRAGNRSPTPCMRITG